MSSRRAVRLAIQAVIGVIPLVFAVALTGTASFAASPPATGQAAPAQDNALGAGAVWEMADSSARHVMSYQQTLSQPNVLIQGTSPITGSPVPSGWASIPEERWTSEAQFSADVAAGTIPFYIRVVHYDNENWAGTPLNEQQEPGLYMRLFCQLAHQHGWLCATGPARDICSVAYPSFRGSLSDCYLANDLAGQAAEYADYTDFQAQALEPGGTTGYASFIATAAAQARASNPAVIALANLTPTPTGATVTASALNADAQAVYPSAVAGFYMTITAGGANTATQFFSQFDPGVPIPKITTVPWPLGNPYDGQMVTVAGTGFPTDLQDPNGVSVLECSDPGGTVTNLPKAMSQCDTATLHLPSVATGTTGTFSTQYPISELTVSGTGSNINCDATDYCVLWVGEDYRYGFLSQAHVFSVPFEVGTLPALAPETPVAIVLPLAAALIVGGSFLVVSRRRRRKV